MSPHRVVAIDGPAASGKSSVARELARRLGFAYINSGAMYRAATWYILSNGVAPNDPEGIARLIESAPIVCDLEENESRIRIGEVDPANFLRDDRVNEGVSLVSSVPRVREILVEKMRSYAQTHDVVMEGRDIGSVVFPDTPYKFYIDASPEFVGSGAPRRDSAITSPRAMGRIPRAAPLRSSSRKMRTSSTART